MFHHHKNRIALDFRRRGWRIARSAALMTLVIALIAALGTAAGPAHAVPLGQCDGPCPTQTTPMPPPPPSNDPRRCDDCNSGATKPTQRFVTVYRSTQAYSTPYLNALKSKRLAAATYPAACEANSGSRGRYSNPWWTRLRDGYWVNNGDLKGPAMMGIERCSAPANDRGKDASPKPPNPEEADQALPRFSQFLSAPSKPWGIYGSFQRVTWTVEASQNKVVTRQTPTVQSLSTASFRWLLGIEWRAPAIAKSRKWIRFSGDIRGPCVSVAASYSGIGVGTSGCVGTLGTVTVTATATSDSIQYDRTVTTSPAGRGWLRGSKFKWTRGIIR
jgi:hypothetical protein